MKKRNITYVLSRLLNYSLFLINESFTLYILINVTFEEEICNNFKNLYNGELVSS